MSNHQRRLWNAAVSRVQADMPIPLDLYAALVAEGLDPLSINEHTSKE